MARSFGLWRLLVLAVIIVGGIEAVHWMGAQEDKRRPTLSANLKVSVNAKDGAEMIQIPAGDFLMGSTDADTSARNDEKPQHTVFLDSYNIYKYPVTVAQYRQFCRSTGREMPAAPKWGWTDNHPVVNVTWDDANAYARWAGGSLPTEAQWEKAARGTDGRIHPSGTGWQQSTSNIYETEPRNTTPVGSRASGAGLYGVMDMAGNVWQWCADWYGEKYYEDSPPRNPAGPKSGRQHVLRGGGWIFTFDSVVFRTALRDVTDPTTGDRFLIGFRCVLRSAGK